MNEMEQKSRVGQKKEEQVPPQGHLSRHLKDDAKEAAGVCSRGRGGKCELGIKGL